MPWRIDHKAKHAAYMREWRKTHPPTLEQRRKALCRSYAHLYRDRGLIERRPCAICAGAAEMHHPDYSQPLHVIWLCREHHLAAHGKVFHGKAVVDPVCELDGLDWAIVGDVLVVRR